MKTEYRKVKDYDKLVRDMKSKAILNTDRNALQEYKKKMENIKKFSEIENDVSSLKQDMADIKEIMYKILEKVNHG